MRAQQRVGRECSSKVRHVRKEGVAAGGHRQARLPWPCLDEADTVNGTVNIDFSARHIQSSIAGPATQARGCWRRQQRRRTSSWPAPGPARAQSGTDQIYLQHGEAAGGLRPTAARRNTAMASFPRSPSAYTRTGRSVGGGRCGMLLPQLGPACPSTVRAGGCGAALLDCRSALPAPFPFTCATITPLPLNRTLAARWRPKNEG